MAELVKCECGCQGTVDLRTRAERAEKRCVELSEEVSGWKHTAARWQVAHEELVVLQNTTGKQLDQERVVTRGLAVTVAKRDAEIGEWKSSYEKATLGLRLQVEMLKIRGHEIPHSCPSPLGNPTREEAIVEIKRLKRLLRLAGAHGQYLLNIESEGLSK